MRGAQFLHWIRYHAGMDPALSQTSEEERKVIARFASGRKNLVEVGVFEGVTSLVIRKAMAPDGCLHCVDPFFSGFAGISFGLSICRKEVSKSQNGEVRLLRGFSHEVAKTWQQPVDFIFFDGDHSEEGIRLDWRVWSPFLSPGAVAAFHDSCGSKAIAGPASLVREIDECSPDFFLDCQVESLSVFVRREGGR